MSRRPEVFREVRAWQARRAADQAAGRSLGFVPTMGALHDGHAALAARARAENATVLVSIFVNPTQFDDPADFARYPQNLEADLDLLAAAGTDYVWAPSAAEMYADGARFRVTEGRDSRRLEGEHRPGHFDGVLTVVLKLLLLARAERAYFGEKDFQQLILVRDLAAAFFTGTDIVPCPTVRAADGLALSSRNARLDPAARAVAPQLRAILAEAPSVAEARARLEAAGFAVDYVEEWSGRRLAAARLGGVRLLDNLPWPPPPPPA